MRILVRENTTIKFVISISLQPSLCMLRLILHNWESCYLGFGPIRLWSPAKALATILVTVVFSSYFAEKLGSHLISIPLPHDSYKPYACGISCKWNLRLDDFRLAKFTVCFNENANWLLTFKVSLDWGISIDQKPVRVVINFNKKDFKDCKFTKEVHRQYNKDKNHN